MIAAGLNLALFGMGTVFVFLVLLIYVTRLMSTLVQVLDAHSARMIPLIPVRVRADLRPATTGTGDDIRLKAILAAAVQQYKSRI